MTWYYELLVSLSDLGTVAMDKTLKTNGRCSFQAPVDNTRRVNRSDSSNESFTRNTRGTLKKKKEMLLDKCQCLPPEMRWMVGAKATQLQSRRTKCTRAIILYLGKPNTQKPTYHSLWWENPINQKNLTIDHQSKLGVTNLLSHSPVASESSSQVFKCSSSTAHC